MKTKKVAIFGSTGSIGTSTLQVIRDNPELFEVVTLVAGTNVELLIDQIKEFHPKHVYIKDEENRESILERCSPMIPKEEIFWGADGMEEISKIYDFDIAVSALVGIAGLKPTYNLMKSGADIALANKEVLVTGGKYIMSHAKKCGARLLTVDSEHSAIMQCLNGENNNEIEKILLTASGGPFLTKDIVKGIKVEDVLKHPTWKMGAKITVDSATMMNKGFEVIEATLLFGVEASQVEVVVHRQSMLHSAVQFKDGTIMASLGPTDMRVPIAYALSYPERLENKIERVDLFKMLTLSFEKPNLQKFPCLQYAFQAIEDGLEKQIVLNAANEVAVANFLNEQVDFASIPEIIYKVLDADEKRNNISINTVEDILSIDRDTRRIAENIIKLG